MKKAFLYLFLVTGALIFLYPFLWMLSATFRPEYEIGQVGLWSENFTLESYRTVFTRIPLGRAFLNSLFVSTCVSASVILFSSIVGYALSRLQFTGRSVILGVILFTMVIPFQITMIPMYILMVKLGWIDNYMALIAPAMISPLGILLFRQFFLNIPTDLLEAARIDGCGNLGILFRVIYPLSIPVIITVALITFMGVWNDILWPILVIRDQKMMTMPQMVTLFAIGGQADQQGPRLAAATLLAVPIVCAYGFFQRYFIESMASSGLKG
jgi:multiple sugar transport system permease protein